ncbi:hypothetical protein SAMN05421749_101506 [Acinetobacter marinus]|uniref:Uncharacterized protein n=1 Tax=Acinetobacter marinus TaxID=281375 RepID=A0A1G6GWE1_9GAMM|nr:hypothetical protein [Acinetobacter marinus]SDB86362.1 hypothetical protein SAMN05421749_101506 [Acinetobacter marinus]
MIKYSSIFAIISPVVVLLGCQTTAQQFNGKSGYEVVSQTAQTTTLKYTLSANPDKAKIQAKLQSACQKVLGANKTYKIDILGTSEVNTQASNPPAQGVNIGQTRATFGLSTTPSLSSTDDYATRQALEAQPKTLNVILYTCTA